MIKQSRTTIKELTAQYRAVLKRAFLAGVIAVATANSANATIAPSDISDINASINMAQSDGSYTTSKGDFNAGTTDYSTEAGYGLYEYDHDNNPETEEIALTTNNGAETLDNTVFTYTDNTGSTTNLGVNSYGFETSDFTNPAGTIDVADGTTDLTTLEANTTTVGLGNYQYMANFDNSGDSLTALTADAPELSSFHNDIILTTGSITVTGNNETNKPSIDQYGFTVELHDGSTGNFDLVYNESTHLYSYNYTGDVELDAADIAAADAQVSSQSANLITDTTLFNDAVTTNTNNYNSTVGHYNNVHGVYESDTTAQNALDITYSNYETSFAEAQANQTAAAGNLSEAQNAYAADLEIYTPVATAYNNYENSLGKSIDAKDETVLTSAKDYADSLADNYDAAGSATTAEQNAKDYADGLASNYDEAGAADTAETNAKAYADGLASNYDAAGSATTAETNAKAYADTAIATINNTMGTIHGLISEESSANRQTTNGKNYKGNLAIGTTVEDHLLALDSAIGDRATLDGDYVDNTEDIVTNLQSLNDGIETEVNRAQTAELQLTNAINTETTRAQGVENGLQNAINQLSQYAANADARILANANAYTDAQVDTLEKNVSGGVAAATALSAVEVSNVKRGEMSVGGGYGYYNGESAGAFGMALGLSDNWSVNAGAGIASGDKTQMSLRAGTNYKFKLF